MITIDVRDNIRLVLRSLDATREEVKGAVTRSLNKTATTVRNEASTEIRKIYNLKAGVIKKQIKIKKANRANPTAIISASGRPIPLIEFTARQRKAGVSVLIKRGQRKVVRSAFIAKMPSGNVGVFQRKGKLRLPIRELFSISLPRVFTSKAIFAALVKIARQRFPVVFAQEARFALSKRK
jgi:hypothetical protein